jgi:hypothetical protein
MSHKNNNNNTDISYFNGIEYRLAQFKLNYRAMIPYYVLLDLSLSANELRLYGIIEQIEASCNDVFITDRTLAYMLNIKHESKMIQRMARKLKSKNYIKREEKEVTINKKTSWLICWSIVKPGNILINDNSVPVVHPMEENSTPHVPVVHPPRVPVVHPPRVPVVHPCNTLDSNALKSNPTPCAASCTGALLPSFSFKDFWEKYPSKKDRKKCAAIWMRRNLDAIASQILEALKNQITEDDNWGRGYIPLPSTYLNWDRWEDEITQPKPDIKKQELDRKKENNEKRMAEQEKLTLKNNAYEASKHTKAHKDGQAFREVKKIVASKAASHALDALCRRK